MGLRAPEGFLNAMSEKPWDNSGRNVALQEKLNDLREQIEELIASSQAHGLLEVAGAEPRGTSF